MASQTFIPRKVEEFGHGYIVVTQTMDRTGDAGDFYLKNSCNESTLNCTEEPPNIYGVEKGPVIFLAVILVLIVIGNLCVLVAIFASKQGHRSRMNFFIMHLAIADLATAFGSVMIDLIWRLVVGWHVGLVMCKLVKFIQAVVTYASTFVLVALSVDRLDAIARPMSFSGSGTRAKILITLAWSFAVLCGSPMLIYGDLMQRFGHLQCVLAITNWRVYLTLVATVVFVIPTVVIAVCYIIIIGIICYKSFLPGHTKSQRRVRVLGNATSNSSSGSFKGNKKHTAVSECTSSSRGVIPQAKVRTIKMTLLIVLAFILCWSPFFIFNLLAVYGHVSKVPLVVQVFIQSLTSLNSLANPVIYGIFSTRICRHLRRVRGCSWFVDRTCCCVNLKEHRRQSSLYMSNSTTYTTVEGNVGKKNFPLKRRKSGPPVVRLNLTAKENQILLKNLKSTNKQNSDYVGSSKES